MNNKIILLIIIGIIVLICGLYGLNSYLNNINETNNINTTFNITSNNTNINQTNKTINNYNQTNPSTQSSNQESSGSYEYDEYVQDYVYKENGRTYYNGELISSSYKSDYDNHNVRTHDGWYEAYDRGEIETPPYENYQWILHSKNMTIIKWIIFNSKNNAENPDTVPYKRFTL